MSPLAQPGWGACPYPAGFIAAGLRSGGIPVVTDMEMALTPEATEKPEDNFLAGSEWSQP
ncbi:MAG: hypothetical protein GX216_08870 [Methanomicrobiales archaeon]|nr:hypothetical protein [Methanomicrobiales archaeon]